MHFGNQPNEFVQPGMLGGVWRGEGKYLCTASRKSACSPRVSNKHTG